jgi:hypothetical protein
MRSLVVALGLLVFGAADAGARPRPPTKGKATAPTARGKHARAATTAKGKAGARSMKATPAAAGKRESLGKTVTNNKTGKAKTSPTSQASKAGKAGGKRVGHAGKQIRRFDMPRGPISGQSLGAPWAGRLQAPAELAPNAGYFIRRPWRAYGTTTLVETVERIVSDVADRFYDTHPIAIGDLSAERGGHISDHSSHQSGRDVDIGLIFKRKPDAYPQSFVVGTADTLDLEATFVLVEEFAKTFEEAGGVQIIFLDFQIQGLLYKWALDNGETPEYLAKLFQYPHGRVAAGIVRHEPHHADHIHVRFRCPPSDAICR